MKHGAKKLIPAAKRTVQSNQVGVAARHAAFQRSSAILSLNSAITPPGPLQSSTMNQRTFEITRGRTSWLSTDPTTQNLDLGVGYPPNQTLPPITQPVTWQPSINTGQPLTRRLTPGYLSLLPITNPESQNSGPKTPMLEGNQLNLSAPEEKPRLSQEEHLSTVLQEPEESKNDLEARLMQEIASYKEELEKKDQEQKEYQAKIMEAGKIKLELTRVNQNLESIQRKNEKDIERLKGKLEANNAQTISYQSALETANDNVAQQTRRIKKLEAALGKKDQKLVDHNRGLRKDIQDVQTELDRSSTNNRRLVVKIEQKDAMIRSLNEKITQKESNIARQIDTIDDLKEKIASVGNVSGKINLQQEKIAELNRDIQTYRQEQASSKTIISDLQENIEIKNRRIKEQSDSIKDLAEEISALKAKQETDEEVTMNPGYEMLEEKNRKLELALQNAYASAQAAQTERAKAEQDKNVLAEKIEKREDELRAVLLEINETFDYLNPGQSESIDLYNMGEANDVNDLIARALQTLSSADAEKENVLAKLAAENKAMATEQKRLSEANTAQQNELAANKAELEAKEAKLAALEAERVSQGEAKKTLEAALTTAKEALAGQEKALVEERAKNSSELAEREAALAEREAVLTTAGSAKTAELKREREELTQTRAKLEEELQKNKQELETQKKELETKTKALATKTEALEEAKKTLEAELTAQESALTGREKTLAEERAKNSSELAKRAGALAAQEEVLTAQKAKLTAESAAVRAELETQKEVLTAQKAALAASRAELEAAEAAQIQEKADLAAKTTELETQREANEAAQEEAKAKLEAQEAALEEREAALEVQEEVLTVQKAELTAERAKLTTEIATERAALEKKKAALERQEEEFNNKNAKKARAVLEPSEEELETQWKKELEALEAALATDPITPDRTSVPGSKKISSRLFHSPPSEEEKDDRDNEEQLSDRPIHEIKPNKPANNRRKSSMGGSGSIGGNTPSWPANRSGTVGGNSGSDDRQIESAYLSAIREKSLKNGFFPITAWEGVDSLQQYRNLTDDFKQAQKNNIIREDFDHIKDECHIQLNDFVEWQTHLESIQKDSTSSNENYAIQIENDTTLHCNNQDKIQKVSTSWATNDHDAAKEAGRKAMRWYFATHNNPEEIKRLQQGGKIPITSDNKDFIDAAKEEGQRLLNEKFSGHNLEQADVFTTRLTQPNRRQAPEPDRDQRSNSPRFRRR
ncbi:MAG: hypothetical protein VYC40_02410 [Pseudomonadota bacterium]|nr:hypothetical protein [Pseudomonadota bacterium]